MKPLSKWFWNTIATAVFFAVINGGNAYADVCYQKVTDNAGILKSKSQVETAIQAMSETGAEAHVITLKSMGTMSMDSYEANLENQCPAWQGKSNTRKNNLVVLMLSMKERKMGLYYGSLYNSLKHDWLRIQQKLMKPKFRDGDYEGGIIAAISEISRITEAELHPSVNTPAVPMEVHVTQTAPVQPTDYTPLTNFLEVAGGGVLILGLLIGGFMFMSKRRKNQEHKRAMRQRAQAAKQQCTAAITETESQINFFATGMNSAAAKVSDDDAKDLQQAVEDVQTRFTQATIEFGNLTTLGSSMDPDQENLTGEEYTQIETSFARTLNKLDDLRVVMKRGEDKMREAGKLPDAIKKAEEHTEVVKSLMSGAVYLKLKAEKEMPQRHVTEMQKAVDQTKMHFTNAFTLIQEAKASMTKEKREVQKGMQATANAEKELTLAEATAQSIRKLSDQFETASQTAKKKINEASMVIPTVNQYLDEHPDDTDPEYKTSLKKSEALLAQAKEALAQTPHDYIESVAYAIESINNTNAILAGAHAQVQSVERARQEELRRQQEAAEEERRARERSLHQTTVVNVYAPSSVHNDYSPGYTSGQNTQRDDDPAPSYGGGSGWSSPTPAPADNDGGGGSSSWAPDPSPSDGGGSSTWSDPSPSDSGGGGGSSDF